jgi:hypothetical protein
MYITNPLPDLPLGRGYKSSFKRNSIRLYTFWIEAIGGKIKKNSMIIHDNGSEFKSATFKQELQDRKLNGVALPSWSGSFLNPCDNSFNRDLKFAYYHDTERSSHIEAIQSMVNAYYKPNEESIQHFFEHCKIYGDTPKRADMKLLASEGYKPNAGYAKIHSECRESFIAWKRNLRSCHST